MGCIVVLRLLNIRGTAHLAVQWAYVVGSKGASSTPVVLLLLRLVSALVALLVLLDLHSHL